MKNFQFNFIVAIILIATHLLFVVSACILWSPANNEAANLLAGVCVWERGEYLYPENPPLMQMLSAIGCLTHGVFVDWSVVDNPLADSRQIHSMAPKFIEWNHAEFGKILTLCRFLCIPITLIGAAFIYLFAKELYGDEAGLLALCLWCLEPNIITSASIVSSDLAACSFGIGAIYGFQRWLKSPTIHETVLAGGLLGMAQVSKTSWLILYCVWPMLFVAWHIAQATPRKMLMPAGCQLLLIVTISVLLTNAFYGFRGTLKRLDSFTFQSQLLSGRSAEHPGNRFSQSPLRLTSVPFPEAYLRGIDTQRVDFESQRWANYMNGHWRHGSGFVSYYVYGILTKVPCGVLILVLISASGLINRPNRFRELLLLAPIMLLLLLVSSQSNFNHHFRYALPAIAGLLVLASGAAYGNRMWSRKLNAQVVVGCVLSIAIGVGTCFPTFGSFFNALAGGPKNGVRHLLHSAIEWGQDLYLLESWAERNPQFLDADQRIAVSSPFVAYDCSLLYPHLKPWNSTMPEFGMMSKTAHSLRCQYGGEYGKVIAEVGNAFVVLQFNRE